MKVYRGEFYAYDASFEYAIYADSLEEATETFDDLARMWGGEFRNIRESRSVPKRSFIKKMIDFFWN